MQAATILHDQRGYQKTEQRTAQRGPQHPEPATVLDRHAPDPRHPHPRRLREEAKEHGVLDEQYQRRDPRIMSRIDEQAGGEHAQEPVDEHRPEAAREARRRVGNCRIAGRGRTLCHGYRA